MCECAWLKNKWSESNILPKPHSNVVLLEYEGQVWSCPHLSGLHTSHDGQDRQQMWPMRTEHNAMFSQLTGISVETDGILTSFPLTRVWTLVHTWVKSDFPSDSLQTFCWTSISLHCVHGCRHHYGQAIIQISIIFLKRKTIFFYETKGPYTPETRHHNANKQQKYVNYSFPHI